MTRGTVKVPRIPADPLVFDEEHISVKSGAQLVRIHRVRGGHPAQWDTFRLFGPIAAMRWDHHEPGPGRPGSAGHATLQPDLGVLYAATDAVTPFAECFQGQRRILATADLQFTTWIATRPLRLLDLGGDWPLHNGAASALTSRGKDVCRAWARAIYAQAPGDIDGLLVPSTVMGSTEADERVVVLWSRAHDSLPASPLLSQRLDDSGIAVVLDRAEKRLRWPVEFPED